MIFSSDHILRSLRGLYFSGYGACNLQTFGLEPVPSLGFAIPDVIALSAEEEMIGVNTAPIITFMEDAEPIRDVSIKENPRYSVGIHAPRPNLFCLERAIALSAEAAIPLPAFSLFDYSLPKTSRNFIRDHGAPETCNASVL